MQGQLPYSQTKEVSDVLWTLAEQCWGLAESRPLVQSISMQLSVRF